MPILGRPMLALQLERLRRSTCLTDLVVATSNDSSDDALADLCTQEGASVFRGSLSDVLNRFAQAAVPYAPEVVVRLTGDCPLADPELIDTLVQKFLQGQWDYLSNCEPATFPDGLDVEVFSHRALLEAEIEAVLPSHREHVTPFIRRQPERFRVGNHVSDSDFSHMRWTVDEPEDFAFVKEVYERLYPQKPDFVTADIMALLEDHPELLKINSRFERNEGARKSQQADTEYLARKK